LQSTYLLQH